MNQTSILVVDDESFSRKLYSEILAEEGYPVKSAQSAEEALPVIQAGGIEILLTDLMLPKMDGIELAKAVKGMDPNIEVIIMTAHGSMESAIEALKFGVAEYLLKPVNPEELKLTVKRLIAIKNVLKENVSLRSTNELMRVLNRISLCIEEEHLSQVTVNLLKSFMKVDASVYLDYSHEKNRFNLKFASGLTKQEIEHFPDTINRLHSGWKSRFGRVKVVKSPLLKMNLKKISENFESFLIIPVTLKKNTLGMIILINRKESGRFNKSLLKIAKIISGHISLTLENCLKFQAAKELAFVDELTGLYNTRYLDYFLETEIKRARRQNYPLSFLFMDLDFFKSVNDTHGHLTGSKLLIEVGRVIKSCVRDIDIIVRYGGDEYIIILVNTPTDGAEMVGKRLREMIKNHLFMKKENLNVRITASLGIATFPVDAQTKEEVIHLADKAMYKAKTTTRDAVYLASKLLG